MFQIPDTMDFPKIGAKAPGWQSSVAVPKIEDEENKKKAFGIELAKLDPFSAACNVFKEQTNIALWVQVNWINDPIVIAAKDTYLKVADASETLLDKDQLAAKLLKMADEKNATNSFHILDGKDRLAALKLYAEVKGFVGKNTDTTVQNFIHNKLTVRFVEPDDKKSVKTIEHNEEEIKPVNPIKLKLVG